MRKWAFCSMAWVWAVKQTDEGSDPGFPVTTGMSRRSPQRWSCWTAAARKVSAAARRTVWPWFFNHMPSLAEEVVLPVPLTPTMRMTVGMPLVWGAGGVGSSGRIFARRLWVTSMTSLADISRPRS